MLGRALFLLPLSSWYHTTPFGQMPWFLWIDSMLVAPAIINLVPDYLSILLSYHLAPRYFTASGRIGKTWIFGLLCTFPIILSYVSFLLTGLILTYFGKISSYEIITPRDALNFMNYYFTQGLVMPLGRGNPGLNVSGIYIYSTFFPIIVILFSLLLRAIIGLHTRIMLKLKLASNLFRLEKHLFLWQAVMLSYFSQLLSFYIIFS